MKPLNKTIDERAINLSRVLLELETLRAKRGELTRNQEDELIELSARIAELHTIKQLLTS